MREGWSGCLPEAAHGLGGFYRGEREGHALSVRAKLLTQLELSSGGRTENCCPAEPWPVSLIGIPAR
jgi:hypothetical protein